MAEEIHHPDGRIEHPQVRFERSDADFGWIMFLLIGTAILAVVIFAAVLGFIYSYRNYQDRIKQSPFPLAPAPSEALPQEPRLEQVDRLAGVQTPNVYLREKAKEDVLNSVGPTTEQGYVHVPIKRAMELLAGKLPARAEPSPEAQRRAGGLVDGGESNSGREFKRSHR